MVHHHDAAFTHRAMVRALSTTRNRFGSGEGTKRDGQRTTGFGPPHFPHALIPLLTPFRASSTSRRADGSLVSHVDNGFPGSTLVTK
jgi:hypothetical protein